MAKYCVCCGSKISSFATEIHLIKNDSRQMCNDCYEKIREYTNKIKTVKELSIVQDCIANISDIAKQNFNENGNKYISEYIEEINKIYSGENAVEADKNIKLKKELISNMILTNGYNFEGYHIKKYIGVISGEVVLGTGFISEFSAALSDLFGESNDAFANKLEAAKEAAIRKLKIKAIDNGGNAIIGIDFDYIVFANNMIGVVANGTNVLIEKSNSDTDLADSESTQMN